jgi:UPF0176 protein
MYLNLATYRFVDLKDLPALKEALFQAGERLGVKGTILLAEEGINAFLCCLPEAFARFSKRLETLDGLKDLDWKHSHSENQAFKRWKVKIKPEIITYLQDGIRPSAGRAASVSPTTLKRWLDQGHDDEGQDVVLLDTRNDFEVGLGSFANAINPHIAKFSELPQWIDAQPEQLKHKRIVSFCTGGIRCEKSALHMQSLGYEKVSQLEGGILRYFEEVGGAHWQGKLFVFDERVGLQPDLSVSALERDPQGGVRAKPE